MELIHVPGWRRSGCWRLLLGMLNIAESDFRPFVCLKRGKDFLEKESSGAAGIALRQNVMIPGKRTDRFADTRCRCRARVEQEPPNGTRRTLGDNIVHELIG